LEFNGYSTKTIKYPTTTRYSEAVQSMPSYTLSRFSEKEGFKVLIEKKCFEDQDVSGLKYLPLHHFHAFSVDIPVWNRMFAALQSPLEYLFSHLSHFNAFSPIHPFLRAFLPW
jgi:hypothetical protein